MLAQLAFFVSIAFSFIAWWMVTARYIWPVLRLRQRADALQPLLILHSFRFLGLAFLVSGVVSPDLPRAFATSAAFGDIVAAMLALLSLLFLRSGTGVLIAWIFNVWGPVDLLNAFYQANATGLSPGQLGAAYFIPTVIVPLLLITHGLAFRILLQHQSQPALNEGGRRKATLNTLNRGASMTLLLLSILSAYPLAAVAQSQSLSTQASPDAPSPKTTEVMVILTAKQGISRQQIMNIMPAEIRATVKLYLDGKIRQWYSRGDGKGVILLIDAKTVEEAHAVIDTMPLSKENLMDHEYIPVGPLMPLAALLSR